MFVRGETPVRISSFSRPEVCAPEMVHVAPTNWLAFQARCLFEKLSREGVLRRFPLPRAGEMRHCSHVRSAPSIILFIMLFPFPASAPMVMCSNAPVDLVQSTRPAQARGEWEKKAAAT